MQGEGLHVLNEAKQESCFGQKKVFATTAIFFLVVSWASFARLKVERKHFRESLSWRRRWCRGTSKRWCTL